MADRPAAEQVRLFVACELPDDVLRALAGIADDLRRQVQARLRWVRPEGIHLTLKFLGGVEAGRVDAIRSALAAAVSPFELRLRPATVGSFPSASLRAGSGSRLRVVWVGLEGDLEGLARLAAAVDGALTPMGFDRERRPYTGHLTLARVPDEVPPRDRREIAGVIEAYRLGEMPSMTLTRVSLIRSILGRGGAVYERLGEFPAEYLDGLGGAGVE